MNPEIVDLLSRVQTGHTTCIRAAEIIEAHYEKQTPNLDTLVNRFLACPLPDSVCSDRCVTEAGRPHRSGTNLLTAAEAKEIFGRILAPL